MDSRKKYELVAKVLAGASCRETAISVEINNGLLYQWVRYYRMKGYQGLAAQRKGRPHTQGAWHEKNVLAELTPSEREEMIQLIAENELLRAENAIIKKKSPWEKNDARRNSRRKSCARPKTAQRRIRTERFVGYNLLPFCRLKGSQSPRPKIFLGWLSNSVFWQNWDQKVVIGQFIQ